MKRIDIIVIANAVLWAGAIFAAGILGAPPVLSAVLLPTLATCSLITLTERRRGCWL
jgi:hypothetical protein